MVCVKYRQVSWVQTLCTHMSKRGEEHERLKLQQRKEEEASCVHLESNYKVDDAHKKEHLGQTVGQEENVSSLKSGTKCMHACFCVRVKVLCE